MQLMLYFSSQLTTDPRYPSAAKELFAALDTHGIGYQLIPNTKSIWMRDFMPVKTRSGRYLSFRYEPCYLRGYEAERTDFRADIAPQLALPIEYSEINLDGGNIVFSPSKETALISDRVFSENQQIDNAALVRALEKLLEARVIIVPSLKTDMTGHADGMVRMIDETTALCNPTNGVNTLETRIIETLYRHGIDTVEFPYFSLPKQGAIGCYLNYLETQTHIFLPVFHHPQDDDAIHTARKNFAKEVVPVCINEIAAEGGVLNCISWETE